VIKKIQSHKNIRVFNHGTAESNCFSITCFDQTIELAFYSNKRTRLFVSFYMHENLKNMFTFTLLVIKIFFLSWWNFTNITRLAIF
jgi:hypothetical protein